MPLRADRAGCSRWRPGPARETSYWRPSPDGNFSESAERSDQDLQDVAGNEALTLSVSPGQTVYFKVSMYGTPDSPISHRLSVRFIPD